MKNKILGLTLLCSMALSMGMDNSKAAAEGTPILVDGKSVPSIQVNQEGRISVAPIFFQRIGVSVDWNPENSTYLLKEGDVELTIFPEDSSSGYIPLRHTVEHLGMEITYDASTSSVHI